MNELFLKIINMSISASWLVLAVLILRLVLKKAPKWINVLLWGIVAIRLICPFSIESALSLIPSAETIPTNIGMDTTPTINSGINVINNAVNPIISQSNTPMAGASANPLQITIGIYEYIWIFGMIAFALCTAISYWHLRRKVDTAVRYNDNVFQSENVSSPFVLGIIKPKIYLPFNMNSQNLEHVVAHEQAHIRRKDHWWKPFGFLLLTIHWFNPLMWLAYILLCRDIELACDEKVIKELGNEQRADYTQALVACSVNRRMIAACPLAFGEVGVKERVKSVMNYKKPAFWIVVLAIATCIIVAICFLTNPAAEREFPINGSNVSTLDTERVVEMIAKAEKLDDGSQLCVNEDNFDLMFTSDFEWANDGAIRFFYLKDQMTYSAQLRMFHDDNKYFITDSVEWVEQEQFFKLIHYLDALKYMPQEEIRKISPDADGFSVYMRNDGVPGDYNRVLKYSQNGVEDIDGWYIHLEVQPLHEVEGGAYNGSGDEVIHLFYGHQDLVMLESDSLSCYTETVFEANFGGNTSFGQKMELTEDYPYWYIEIENTGNGTVQMEIQGEVYRIEAGATEAFYANEKWEAGTYAVSFSTAGYQPMYGSVICTRSAVPMTDNRTTSDPTYNAKGVSAANVKELSNKQDNIEWQDGLTFTKLAPGREVVSSFDIIIEEECSVLLAINWARLGLFMEYGIRAEDGTEYFQEKQGGASRLLIEDIPAGTYRLYAKNSDAYSGLPPYENPTEYDVSFDAEGVMLYSIVSPKNDAQ